MAVNDWIAGHAPLASNLKSDALELWAAHRTEIVLAVFAVLVAVRMYLHANDGRGELVALPRIYGRGEPSTAGAEGTGEPSDSGEETDSLSEGEPMATGAGGPTGSRRGLRRRAG